MGKRWNRKRKAEERRQKSEERKKNIPEDLRNRGYVFNVQYSALMEAYYAYQGLFDLRREGFKFVPCKTDDEKEEERKRYNHSIQSILPASFRLGSDCHPLFRDKFIKELDEHAGKPIEITIETNSTNIPNDDKTSQSNTTTTSTTNTPTTITKILPPIRRIPFIPHGYQLSVDRRTIRRNPSLSPFHEWLKIQTNAGFITRQETVSMIPPVVLDVKPHHFVLDMCAAPGSKTSQMLEIVSSIPTTTTTTTEQNKDAFEPKGFIVANDSDPKRAYMLIHNLRRINSPAAFTGSVDAQFFPQLKGYNNTDGIHEGLFDRVLCDVPCSGDGTMRKNPGIWKFWNPLGSFALHPLQLNIAIKGATLTKVGGYMCYSTCSMNPIENEAVVAEILRKSKGNLELVDKRKDMPGIVARPGWNTWKVMCTLKKDKNKLKKNSPKMIQKRKEWEEKLKKAGVAVTTTAATSTSTNSSDVKMADVVKGDASVNQNENGTNKEELMEDKTDGTSNGHDTKQDENSKDEKDENKEDPVKKPPNNNPVNQPLSWNEEALREKAASLGILFYDRYEDVPEHMNKRIRSTCFPPTKEETESFHLERCMRCLPHDMDTGGFFIALFRKLGPVGVKARNKNKNSSTDNAESMNESDEKIDDHTPCTTTQEDVEMKDAIVDDNDNDGNDTSQINLKAKKGKERGRGATRGDVGNSDFVPVPPEIFPNLVKFYGLAPNFPQDQIMCRECGDAKILHFITKSIKENLIDRGIQRITVINSGLKVFERNSKECDVRYRVNQEGIHMIAPYMTKRKIVAKFKDFANCLNPGAIHFKTFSNDFAEKLAPLSTGSFVVVLEGFEEDIDKKMFLVMWRCRGASVNCLVSKIEIDGVKCKLRAIADLNNLEYDPDAVVTPTVHDKIKADDTNASDPQ